MARLARCSMSGMPVCACQENEDDVTASPGDRIIVEGKLKWDEAARAQCMGHATILLFTMNTRHPTLNPLVPALAITKHCLMASLYDCKADVLLELQYPETWLYTADKGTFDDRGLVILWVLLHYRLFIRQVNVAMTDGACSGLIDIVKRNEALAEFRQLYTVNIASFGTGRKHWEARTPVPVRDELFTPAKKPKLSDENSMNMDAHDTPPEECP